MAEVPRYASFNSKIPEIPYFYRIPFLKDHLKKVSSKIIRICCSIFSEFCKLLTIAKSLLNRVKKSVSSDQRIPHFTLRGFSPHPYTNRHSNESYFFRNEKKIGKSNAPRHSLPLAIESHSQSSPFTLNDLDCIYSPPAKEALMEIYELASNKYDGSSPFVAELMKILINATKTRSKKLGKYQTITRRQHLEETSILGKVLFLIDKSPQALVQNIHLNSPQQSLKWIEINFNDLMQKQHNSLLELFKNHQKTGLQQTEIAINNQIPMEISKLLWTSRGTLNLWLIESVKNFFLEHRPGKKNYEINLSINLKALQSHINLRKKLEAIQKPQNPNSLSHQMICIILGIPVTSELTDLQTKQVALGALLSHLRQEEEGECFALFLAIELLVSQQEKCIEDFTSLLESSKMSRHINNKRIDLPYLLKLEDLYLDLPFTVNRQGKLNDKEGYLWESPGIQSVCQVLGILNPALAIRRVLLLSEAKHEATFPCTPRKLMRLLAQDLEPRHQDRCEALFAQAKLTFEAQTHNLLLHAWGNAIAGMAEADANGYIKETIINSVIHAFKVISNDHTLKNPEMLTTLALKWEKELQNTIHLYYDPTVANQRDSWNTNQIRGAFVLYEKESHQEPHDWKRVDHYLEFQKFLNRTLNNACVESVNPESPREIIDQWNALKHKSLTSANTPVFLYAILKKYQQAFPSGETLSQGYENLKCTPWLNKLGHDARLVCKVYSESQFLPHMEKINPKNGIDLLHDLIKIGRGIPLEKLKRFEQNPYQLVPLRVRNMHAFSLMIHPEMVEVWKSKQNIDKWIQEKVVLPGKKVSQTSIDYKTKHKLIKFAQESLIEKNMMRTFQTQAAKISENYKISDFRQQLLKLICNIGQNPEKTVEEIALSLDTYLCEILPTVHLGVFKAFALPLRRY